MTIVTDLKPTSFDRTSGWVHYVRTAQALPRLKGSFHLDWEVQRQDRLLESSCCQTSPSRSRKRCGFVLPSREGWNSSLI